MSRLATEAPYKLSRLRSLCVAALAVSTAVVPGSASALGLGDLQVRSFIGEPLDASVVIFVTEEEEISAECFAVGAPAPGGVPSLLGPRLIVERAGRRALLRLRTDQAMTEPVMRFRLTSTCSNAGGLARDYVFFLDPRPAGASTGPVVIPPPVTERPAGRPIAAVTPSAPPELAAAAAPTKAPAASAAPPKRTAGTVSPPPKRPPATDAAKAQAGIEPKAEAKAAPAPAAAPAKAAAAPAPARDGPELPFRLRLSGPELDTSRGAVDERRKAEIRERRLLLEQDDQTAVILRLRESLRQLEGQLASIQQQVATVPATAPTDAPKAAPPAPAALPSDAPPFAPKPAPEAPRVARPTPPASSESSVDWPFIAIGVLFALIAAGLSLWKRRKERAPVESTLDTPITFTPQAPTRPGSAAGPAAPKAPGPKASATKPPAPKREPRMAEPAPGSDAAAPVSTASAEEAIDLGTLRRRYRQSRFPELMEGTVSLGDSAAVIRGARTLYEDGDAPRAIEFLELAITDNPKPVELWLALFEVYRQEGLAAEFGNLAARFHSEHGSASQWSKVQSIGREFDPDNSLFVNERGEAFNPLTDNWLGVPSDYSADGLAAELHKASLVAARGQRVG